MPYLFNLARLVVSVFRILFYNKYSAEFWLTSMSGVY